MGADGRRRDQCERAREGVRAGEGRGGQAEVARRQDRRGRGQEELLRALRSLSRQARQGARSARREDQESDPRDQLGRPRPPRVVPAKAGTHTPRWLLWRCAGGRLSLNKQSTVVMGPGFRRDDNEGTGLEWLPKNWCCSGSVT